MPYLLFPVLASAFLRLSGVSSLAKLFFSNFNTCLSSFNGVVYSVRDIRYGAHELK